MNEKEEKLARAISASSRRRILNLLTDKERTVKEIAEITKMSVSLASRHLKMLYDLGFLNVKIEFPYKYYSLRVKDIKQLLLAYEKVVSKL